jgi:hypothetical protein
MKKRGCYGQRPFCNRYLFENYHCEGYDRTIIFVSHKPDDNKAGKLVTVRPRLHSLATGKSKDSTTKGLLSMSLVEQHLIRGAWDQITWGHYFEFILPNENKRRSPDKAGSNPYTWAAALSLCTIRDTLQYALRAVCPLMPGIQGR